MITIIGSVGTRSSDEALDQFELRHFELQTSVYDTLKAAPVEFSVVCFFESGKRWRKVKMPSPGCYISVTATIVGCTTETNCLAVRVLYLAYLPRPSSSTASPPKSMSTPTPTPKRSNSRDGRVDSSTRLKLRKLDTGS
jgi:hypothetical protein